MRLDHLLSKELEPELSGDTPTSITDYSAWRMQFLFGVFPGKNRQRNTGLRCSVLKEWPDFRNVVLCGTVPRSPLEPLVPVGSDAPSGASQPRAHLEN